jgi:hypothetical protein
MEGDLKWRSSPALQLVGWGLKIQLKLSFMLLAFPGVAISSSMGPD